MDNEHFDTPSQPDSLGKVYFTGVALFILASVVLSVWAFVSLALTR